MITKLIRFIDLLVMSLLVGTMFGIWIGFNPSGLSAVAYVEQQQNSIRAFNTLLPALGAVCILLTSSLALLQKVSARSRSLLIVAAVCLVAAGLITRFGNQPINSQVMTWTADAPPENWRELRDTWWHWHITRTVAGLFALSFTLLGTLDDSHSLGSARRFNGE